MMQCDRFRLGGATTREGEKSSVECARQLRTLKSCNSPVKTTTFPPGTQKALHCKEIGRGVLRQIHQGKAARNFMISGSLSTWRAQLCQGRLLPLEHATGHLRRVNDDKLPLAVGEVRQGAEAFR